MATWPASLPQKPLEDGFSRTIGDGNLESNVDVGAPKARRLTSVPIRPMKVKFKLTHAQRATLEDFVEDDLSNGIKPYSWTHPLTQQTANWRIQGGTVQFTVRAAGWEASMTLLEIP